MLEQREWRSTTPLSPSLIHNNCVRRPPLANHMWVRRSGSVLSAMKIRPLLPILLRLFFPRRDTTWYQLQPLQQKDILLSGAIVFDTLRAFFRSFGVRKVGSKERGEREERKIRPQVASWQLWHDGINAKSQHHRLTKQPSPPLSSIVSLDCSLAPWGVTPVVWTRFIVSSTPATKRWRWTACRWRGACARSGPLQQVAVAALLAVGVAVVACGVNRGAAAPVAVPAPRPL